jgi:phosphate transport system substrate-binding protein
MRRTLVSAVAAAAVSASLFAAAPAQAAEVDITGSGSSFAYNFLNKCATQYQAKTGNKVSYAATGSGAGRKALVAKTVDFAASDSPYGSSEAKPTHAVTYAPVIGGAIAMVFNIDGVKDLNLDAATIGGIFDGSITKWNDPKLVALNKKAKLPDATITPVYRSTNSGTTQNFQEYLNENVGGIWPNANQAWAGMKTGANVSVSSDMAYKVKTTANSIGYVDLSDVDVKVGKAAIKVGKKFVKPTVATTSKALSKQTVGPDGTMNIDFTKKVDGGYPLSIVTYVIIPMGVGEKGKATAAFASYAVETCSKKPFKGYAGFTGANLKKAAWFAKQGS